MPCRVSQDGLVIVENFGKKCDPLEAGMANHSSILATSIPRTEEKGKNIERHPRLKGVQNATGEKQREILIAPERMKQLDQS